MHQEYLQPVFMNYAYKKLKANHSHYILQIPVRSTDVMGNKEKVLSWDVMTTFMLCLRSNLNII